MEIKETVPTSEQASSFSRFAPQLEETLPGGRAKLRVEHWRPRADGTMEMVGEPEEVWNQITNSGRDFLHLQGYGTSGLGTNGLNWIGLTNTAITPGPTDTSLAGEITANGLSRAQGVVVHTSGTNTTTVSNTFTCATAPQAAQAAALFTTAGPPVAGIMNHELTFAQRSLQIGDQLVVTFTITLG